MPAESGFSILQFEKVVPEIYAALCKLAQSRGPQQNV